MRDLIKLPVSVKAWNAIKFLLLESVVSLVFAPLWTRYIQSTCHRMVEKEEDSATVFSSEIGRLTPASVMVYRTCDRINIGSLRLDMKPISRAALLLVNVFLLGSLLVTEYGSGSRSSYQMISANITDMRKHEALVAGILREEIPTSALHPLELAPHDYSYADDQSSISLKRRVRTLQGFSEVVHAKNADKESKGVSICGISSTSTNCDHSFDDFHHAMLPPGLEDPPKLFQVGNVTKVSTKFRDVQKQFYFAKGVQEVGEGYMLYSEPRNYTMDCVVEDYNVTRSNYMSYQLNFCVSDAGRFGLFFFLEEMEGVLVDILLQSNPELKKRSEVHLASGRIYRKSIFGIEKSSIYSRDAALYQLLHMDTKLNEYKKFLGQSESIFLDYLKERMLWALLGAVSGNSAIGRVEVLTVGELATLNALFVIGVVGIFFALLLLLIFGSYSGPRQIFMPVDSAAMLRSLSTADDGIQKDTVNAERGWPLLCITRTGKLSFSGG